MQVTPVDRQDVLACLHVHSGLGQWSLQAGIPVFSVVHSRHAIAAVFDRVICAQQAAFYFLGIWLMAAAHEHVSYGHFAEGFLK